MLKKLLPLIPQHEVYGEVFGGGLALFGAKPRSPLEIINDINGDLISLYLSVQRHLPEMLRQIDMAISSRELLFKYIEQPGLTDIERATRFLVRNYTSFSGKGTSFGVTKQGNGGGADFKRDPKKELLKAMHNRLDGVIIEHLTWERFIELYDGNNVFFFLDPPYIGNDNDAYDGWKEENAVKLKESLDRLKAKWLLTINDSPFTRHLFKGCNMDAVVTQNRLANNRTHSDSKFGELIITPRYQNLQNN